MTTRSFAPGMKAHIGYYIIVKWTGKLFTEVYQISIERWQWNMSINIKLCAGFTYRLDRLEPMASKFKGPPIKVYSMFNTVIGLSHLCCHNVLYFLNNPSVIFFTQLHSMQNIAEF
jgi:hypothetical protein